MTARTPLIHEVFILGAGFSRAVSAEMPTTNDLGADCLELAGLAGRPGIPSGPFTGGQFEAWLSRIAEPQPYLDEKANALNNARFLAVRDAIYERLTEATIKALDQPWKPWLPTLLRLAHRLRAVVITFNYDTLVECAVASSAILTGSSAEGGVSADSLTGGVPPAPVRSGMWGDPVRAGTFTLLKLHGSLNWWAMDGDAAGISMLSGPLPGFFGRPDRPDPAYIRRFLPGRSPFVVPPASAKSRYFANPIVRQIWSDAYRALRMADRVTFLGYSLPLEDGIFAGMLTAALHGRDDCAIDIADYTASSVEQHLAVLKLKATVADTYSGGNSVQDLVAARVKAIAAQLPPLIAANIAEFDPDTGASIGECRLLVEFDTFLLAVVRKATRSRDVITLHCDPPEERSPAFFDRASDSGPRNLVPAHTLTALLPGTTRIEAACAGQVHVMFRHDVTDVVDGVNGPWMLFGSATTPRSGAKT